MKKKFKKACAVFLIIMVTIVFSPNVNAEPYISKFTFTNVWLTFDIWQGNGVSSISIGDDFLTKDSDIAKFEEFEEILYDGKSFDDSNYTVTKVNNNTVITLKEEYLKTLKDGTYLFNAVFSRAIIPMRLYIVTHKILLTDAYFEFDVWTGNGSAQVKMNPTTYSIDFYPELLV